MLSWIVWWSLGTVVSQVIITWLYNNTGRSIFVAILFHTMSNLTWQLFPINGSDYDPRVTGLITVAVAVVVVIVWGPQTLVRARNPRRPAVQAVVSPATDAEHTFRADGAGTKMKLRSIDRRSNAER